ncbi:MAG: hypothetical protein ACREOO_18490 [bacterium]
MKKTSKRKRPLVHAERKAEPALGDLSVKIVARGPDVPTFNALRATILKHPMVGEFLKRTRHRLLSLDLLEPEPITKPQGIPAASQHFRATIYDYTNNRTVLVEGRLGQSKVLQISESGAQPLPSPEEFQAAVQALLKDKDLGPALREKRLLPYPPMPPLLKAELPDGRTERIVAVGLLPLSDEVRHEIVGIHMIRPELLRFENRAPLRALAHHPICGSPFIPQPTARHTPGQATITITLAGTVLWKFVVVRPAASAGTNGSGIELRYVDYRGKRVLHRAHVPILNVKYDNDACGPYRDWQNQEGMIQAAGQDVAPGFRLCPSPAKTILDTGDDAGDFLGVAIYVQGSEVVLVSEMEAGWYRYVSEWRFHADGTIRPRFGFSAVQNSCVCSVHHHHAYWRFDFDIRTSGNNLVQEFNDPPLMGSSHWHTKKYEVMRLRDPARRRKWRVLNSATGEGYEIIPGPDDGIATHSPDWPFAQGDVWALRYNSNEIDDGVVAVGPPYEAPLNGYVNGELIENQDVVLWYAGHFTHDLAELPGGHGHIVGPDLKPFKW